MFDAKTAQLNGLRDALKRNGMMYSDVGRLMDEFVQDDDLRRLFGMDKNEHYFYKAVWYCICNNNADRDMLIHKLNEYFSKYTRKNQVGELIKYALFLGGVDYQLNDIVLTTSTSTRGSESIAKGSGNEKSEHISYATRKWVKTSVIAVTCLLAVVIITMVIGNGNRSNDVEFSVSDIRGNYSGIIEIDGNRTDYDMSISADLEVVLTTTRTYFMSKPEDSEIKPNYSAQLKGDMLKLKKGPNLKITKENKKIRLSCKGNAKYGNWYFNSK